jgi:hypothetical protein
MRTLDDITGTIQGAADCPCEDCLMQAARIIYDELSDARGERDNMRNALHLVNLANEGHVRMIADLAAERDNLKERLSEAYQAMNTLTERAGVLIHERDSYRAALDMVNDDE